MMTAMKCEDGAPVGVDRLQRVCRSRHGPCGRQGPRRRLRRGRSTDSAASERPRGQSQALRAGLGTQAEPGIEPGPAWQVRRG